LPTKAAETNDDKVTSGLARLPVVGRSALADGPRRLPPT
jgi:hypothetical protein